MGDDLTNVEIDINEIIEELTNRLAAATFENVKLTIAYRQLHRQRSQQQENQ